MSRSDDASRFPAPVYARTVLAPLFETAKRHFARHFRAIDEAHCIMLAETSVLTRSDAAVIAAALMSVERDFDLAGAVYDGSVEDVFFLIEGELKRRVGADLGGKLHTGRSRNDIDHCAYRLELKARLDDFSARLRALAAALLAVAERDRATIVVAYTHGQPAQPTTYGHYLAAAIEVVLRDLERIAAARRVVDLCPMGAAAITTTGFPLDRARMAELLGFPAALENSYGCIAAVDHLSGAYAALKLVALHLGRLVQDLQFWTSFEVGQLFVPDGFVQVSSIMPQKRNPAPIEHLRLMLSLAAGRAEAILNALHNTPFTDMNDAEGPVQAEGYGAFELMARALDLLAGLVAASRIDEARARRIIAESCITVTELADTLVRREGLSFRLAHEIAGATARAVIAAKSSLEADGEKPFRAAFREAVGRETILDGASFRSAVSPEGFVAVRERFGGPGPVALGVALVRYRGQIDGFAKQASEMAGREVAAKALRRNAFAALASERRHG